MRVLRNRIEAWSRFGFFPRDALVADWGKAGRSRWVVLVEFGGHAVQTHLHDTFQNRRAAERCARAINALINNNSYRLAAA